MRRAILTMAHGSSENGEMAMGLARSLSLIGDSTIRIVLTDLEDQNWARYFDHVIPVESSGLISGSAVWDEINQLIVVPPNALAFRRLDALFDALAGGLGTDSLPECPIRFYDLRETSLEIAEVLIESQLVGEGNATGDEWVIDVKRNRCHKPGGNPGQAPALIAFDRARPSRRYRRQLSALKALEEYEDRHPFGYFSPWSKFSRSFQRRILKLQGRL